MKTLKKLLFIIMAVAVLAMPVFGVQAAESDIPVTEQPGVSSTPSPVPIRELVTKGNKIYYYYKGKMVKNKWKRYNGYKYYFGANGNAVRGGQRINNVVYVFDEKGRLFENKQNKIVKSGSNIYHIRTEHGRASIGYFIYKINFPPIFLITYHNMFYKDKMALLVFLSTLHLYLNNHKDS